MDSEWFPIKKPHLGIFLINNNVSGFSSLGLQYIAGTMSSGLILTTTLWNKIVFMRIQIWGFMSVCRPPPIEAIHGEACWWAPEISSAYWNCSHFLPREQCWLKVHSLQVFCCKISPYLTVILWVDIYSILARAMHLNTQASISFLFPWYANIPLQSHQWNQPLPGRHFLIKM